MRKLQRYIVNLPNREIALLRERGDIEEILPGMYVQCSHGLYDATLGLMPEESARQADDWVL